MPVHANRNSRPRMLRIACSAALPLCSAALPLCSLVPPALAANKSWDTAAGTYNVAGNWTPAGVPLNADSVFIGDHAAASNDDVTANAPVRAAALTISDGMRLISDSASIIISGPVLITGQNTVGDTDYPSSLLLDFVDGSSFGATGVQVLDGGQLRLRSGCYAGASGLVRIDAESELGGYGTLTLTGPAPRALVNDGVIDPNPDGLAIRQIGAGLLDLDGDSGNGQLNLGSFFVSTGAVDQMSVQGTALADAFDGYINMLQGATLDMDLDNGWTLGVNGELHAYGYDMTAVPARIQGGPLTVAGRMWLNGDADSILEVEAAATIVDGGEVDVAAGCLLHFEGETTVDDGEFTVSNDANLRFYGDTTLNGGTFTVPGISPTTGNVRFHGPTDWHGNVAFDVAANMYNTQTVTAASVIDAGIFDMDGSGSTVWNISAPFIVNAARLEAGANNAFEGEMNIGGGFLGGLTVNLSEAPQYWIMMGEMNLTGDLALFVTRVSGSPMTVWGDLTVTSGKVQIAADTRIDNSAVINLAAATTALRFFGETTVQPFATFTGIGTVHNGQSGWMRLDGGASLDQVGIVNNGTFLVGAGAGVASVDRFQNTDNGTLYVSIGGYAAGSEHDLLIVSDGPAQLAGTLEVVLIDTGDGPFEPAIGDEFTILTAAGGIVGTFDTTTPSCGRDGLSYHWTVLYESNEVTMQLASIASGLPGDVNCDCAVNFLDIDPFLLAVFSPDAYAAAFPTCPISRADVNADGLVNFFDIDAFVAVLFP